MCTLRFHRYEIANIHAAPRYDTRATRVKYGWERVPSKVRVMSGLGRTEEREAGRAMSPHA
jgi:hypothetical protein